ncbi:MAG: hypothetical protein ACTTI9_00655 [Schaalia odontolytica]
MTRLVPALSLVFICVLATSSCSAVEDAGSAQSTPAVTVSPGDPGQPSRSTMPTLHAASPGCAAMDEIFTEALNGSETGQVYRDVATKASEETTAEERHRAWEAFAADFKNDYSERLVQAATDETSKQALAALAVYVERNAALDSGTIPEFADQEAAEAALKRGEKPEVNPAYTQALAEATDAHSTLTTCMPHWPIVF